jgi:hypothetical protein
MAEHYDVPAIPPTARFDLQTSGMWLSIALAVVIELPLAFLLLNAAPHPALRARGGQRAGGRRAPAVLWRIPLVGEKAASGSNGLVRDRRASSPAVAHARWRDGRSAARRAAARARRAPRAPGCAPEVRRTGVACAQGIARRARTGVPTLPRPERTSQFTGQIRALGLGSGSWSYRSSLRRAGRWWWRPWLRALTRSTVRGRRLPPVTSPPA